MLYRSSVCDRPRTYDKFYRKGPSNFQGGIGETGPSQNDNLTNVCSSEENIPNVVSSGGGSQRSKRKKKRRGSEKLQYSRTITEKDVRSIERHLSMKKTIRKKIMRDLQQAFVEGDPNEITKPPTVTITPEQVNELNLKSLNINPKQNSKSDPNFLDLLRGDESANNNVYSDDSGHCSGPSPVLQTNHHHNRTSLGTKASKSSVPTRPTKRYNFISDSGGSSCGGDEGIENVVCDDEGDEDITVIAAEQVESRFIDGRMIHPAEYFSSNTERNVKTKNSSQMKNSNYMNSYLEGKTIFYANDRSAERNYVNIQDSKNNDNKSLDKNKKSNGKKTFWQKLTGGGGNCSGKNRDSSKQQHVIKLW